MFEYMAVVINGVFYCHGFPWHAERAIHINKLGEEGWELVAVYMEGVSTMAYFKREISGIDKPA